MQQQKVFQAPAPITCVKYQPENALVVFATQAGEIYGLNAADKFRLLFEFSTGLASVDGLDIHPHAKVIAVAGQGTHQFWDLTRQQKLSSIEYPAYRRSVSGDGAGFCLRFHCSDWAIFGSYGTEFVARNYKTGEHRELFIGSESNVCLDFHPSSRLALASLLLPQDSARIVFFEFLASGACTLYRQPEIEFLDDDIETDIPVNAVFSPQGNQLLSSTTNRYIMQTQEETKEVGALLGFVMSHRFPSGELVHEVPILGKLEDLEKYENTGPEGQTLYGAGGWLSNIAVLGGGAYGACGTQSGDLALVDYQAGKVVYQENVHQKQINSAAALGREQVITGGEEGSLMLCDFSKEIASQNRNEQHLQEDATASEQEFYKISLAATPASGVPPPA